VYDFRRDARSEQAKKNALGRRHEVGQTAFLVWTRSADDRRRGGSRPFHSSGGTMLNSTILRAMAYVQAAISGLRDEDGQTLAEYGLIVAIIAVAVVIAAGITFRGAIAGAFNSSTSCLNKASSTGTC
jgi:Flp pilus assembly pilin Flp